MLRRWWETVRATWRALPVVYRDGALATVFVAVGQIELLLGEVAGSRLAQHLVFAVLAASVTVRRSRPVLAATVAGVALAVQSSLGEAPVASGYLAYLLIVYTVARHASSRRLALLGLAVLLLDAVVYPLANPDVPNLVGDGIVNAGIVVVLWLLSRIGREQTDRAVAAERAVSLERFRAQEQAARQAEAVDRERGRIARECHDVVAHGVTLMLLHAEAAQARLGIREPEVAGALDVVTTTGRAALADVRQVLTVLRADTKAESGRLAGLPESVAQARAAGAEVEMVEDSLPSGLPPLVDSAVFRVVQEALTNALRHAPGSTVRVSVTRSDDDVHILVLDDGNESPATAPDSGLGIVGIQERITLLGGRLTAGPRPDGPGWQVAARLPVTP